jgi:hypothetical protein
LRFAQKIQGLLEGYAGVEERKERSSLQRWQVVMAA